MNKTFNMTIVVLLFLTLAMIGVGFGENSPSNDSKKDTNTIPHQFTIESGGSGGGFRGIDGLGGSDMPSTGGGGTGGSSGLGSSGRHASELIDTIGPSKNKQRFDQIEKGILGGH